MKGKQLMVACGFVFLPLLAQAQPPTTTGSESLMVNLLETVIPFLFIGVLVWFFFTRAVRRTQGRSQEYMSEIKAHNVRVEELLARIVKAVEKKDDAGPRQP